MAHDQDLLLLGGQFLDEVAKPGLSLLGNLDGFGRIFRKLHGVEDRAAVFQHNGRIPLAPAEGVNGQIMSNPA